MSNYNIIDNFLEDKEFNIIKDIFNSTYFPWFYNNEQTKNDASYFNHIFYKDNNFNSPYSNQVINPILQKLKPITLIRIMANLLINTGTASKSKNHTDHPFSHTTAIFYINTNNGMTILDENKKIKCIENRLLIFDGLIKHYAIRQTDEDRRMVININFIDNEPI